MQQGLEYAYNQITIATLHQNHFSTDLLQNDTFFIFTLYTEKSFDLLKLTCLVLQMLQLCF